jgi:hypothetical protein
MKIMVFIEDGRPKKVSPRSKSTPRAPTVFAGNDAPLKIVRYFTQKYHISQSEIEKKVD